MEEVRIDLRVQSEERKKESIRSEVHSFVFRSITLCQ